MTYLEGEAEIHPLDRVEVYHEGGILDLYLTELPQYVPFVSRFEGYWPHVDRIHIRHWHL